MSDIAMLPKWTGWVGL